MGRHQNVFLSNPIPVILQIFIPFPYPLLFYIFYRPTFPANFPQKITFYANRLTVLWWYLAFHSFTTTCLFFKVVSKVRFFCNLADHFSSKLLNWATFRKEWHTKIIFACAIICLVGYLYFYWCNCGESFQRMVYFLHICMIDNGLFWYL